MSEEERLSQLQVSKKEYLARLSDEDRKNLKKVEQEFARTIAENGRRGALLAVGGTINKFLPRKDLDLKIILEEHLGDPSEKEFPTIYRWALEDFKIIDQVVKDVVGRTGKKMKIEEKIPPSFEDEFQSENMMKFDGVIKVRPEKGTPIEFLRESRRGVDAVIKKQTKPFVILTRK